MTRVERTEDGDIGVYEQEDQEERGRGRGRKETEEATFELGG